MNKQILVSLYEQFGIPCDRLVSNPATLIHFTKAYNRKTGEKVQPSKLSQKLLNLRRRGQAKGGLPRLERNYWGRDSQR